MVCPRKVPTCSSCHKPRDCGAGELVKWGRFGSFWTSQSLFFNTDRWRKCNFKHNTLILLFLEVKGAGSGCTGSCPLPFLGSPGQAQSRSPQNHEGNAKEENHVGAEGDSNAKLTLQPNYTTISPSLCPKDKPG